MTESRKSDDGWIQKYGAVWPFSPRENELIISERIDEETELLCVVLKRADGSFLAKLFERTSGLPQWICSFWCERSLDAIFADAKSAEQHLSALTENARNGLI